jgi:hypothetical protein
VAWIRTSIGAAAARSAFGAAVDPMAFVPPIYRLDARPQRTKTQEEIEVESRAAWAALDSFFRRRR